MLLLCDGMPRSASTWAYNVVFALLKTAFPKATIQRRLQDGSPSAAELVESRANWEVMKSHRLDDFSRSVFRAGHGRSIYTHRDIFDAMASYLVMFRMRFDWALLTMEEALDVYDFHYETGNFLSVDYESVVNRSRETIRAIAGFLELELPESEIAAIDEAHSFSAIKELSAKLKEDGTKRLISNGMSCLDLDSQWHVRHVRNGGIGYGRKYLMPQQIEQIENVIRNRKGPSRNILPALPSVPARAGAAG